MGILILSGFLECEMKLGKIRNDRYDADNGGNFSIELHTDIFHPHALLAQNYNIPALVEDVTHEDVPRDFKFLV